MLSHTWCNSGSGGPGVGLGDPCDSLSTHLFCDSVKPENCSIQPWKNKQLIVVLKCQYSSIPLMLQSNTETTMDWNEIHKS